jgi:hypothetical protein
VHPTAAVKLPALKIVTMVRMTIAMVWKIVMIQIVSMRGIVKVQEPRIVSPLVTMIWMDLPTV